MASSWTEMLCLDKLAKDRWRHGFFSPMWLGSIYDLVPEEELYDADGELVIPETWEGHKIVGLGDGEYLETDELLERGESIEFSRAELDTVHNSCRAKGWSDVARFNDAWSSLQRIVGNTA